MLANPCDVAFNDSVATTIEQNYSTLDLVLYCVKAIEGLTLVIGGAAIALPILYHVALRRDKGNILILGVTLFPAGMGLGLISAPFYRIPVLLAGRDRLPATKFFCWLLPYSQLYLVFVTPSALIQTAVAIDRLVAVSQPLRHLSLGSGYGWRWFFGCFAHGIILYVVSFVQAWTTSDRCDEGATEVCSVAMGRRPWIDSYSNFVSMLGAIGSIAVMAITLHLYRKRKNKVGISTASEITLKAQLKQEQRLTKSFAISTGFTLLLHVLPISVDIMLDLYVECRLCRQLSAFVWMFFYLNSVMNIYIFLFRHKKIRVGLMAAIKRKQMPANINLWNSVW